MGRSAAVEGVSCWQPAAALGGGATQFSGISAIPSPPTVLFNTSQQMQAQVRDLLYTGGLYVFCSKYFIVFTEWALCHRLINFIVFVYKSRLLIIV